MAADQTATPLNSIVAETDGLERETMRRVTWRLLPILALGYFCASLDRSNIGMAATRMSPDLGFSNAQFGFGAGVFFFGYLLAEIPSNLILNRIGARRWLSRILITWGVVSGLTAFAWNSWSFYGIRFLLGIAEAGFFPGVLLYITWWFPARYRSRTIALFMAAGVMSGILGPPIGGLLLALNGVLGLAGWQWLFIVEALPSIVACVIFWRMLSDRPADAPWLTRQQKQWLTARLDAERTQRESQHGHSLRQAFASPAMWLLTLVEFGHQVAGYGLGFFMPLIVKGLGVATSWIGVVSAVPALFGFTAMIVWGRHSDRTGERTWHAAGALLLVAAGLVGCTAIGGGHPVLMMIALCITITGNQSVAPCFWSIPSSMLSGTAAAGGLAMVNSLGNLGGWFGPWMYGLVKDATDSTSSALFSLAAGPLVAAIVLIALRHNPNRDP
jgi:MFS family permease